MTAFSEINVGNSADNRAAAPKFHLQHQGKPLLMQRAIAKRGVKPCCTSVLHVDGGIDPTGAAAPKLIGERAKHRLADPAIARRGGDINIVELGDDAAYGRRNRVAD